MSQNSVELNDHLLSVLLFKFKQLKQLFAVNS